MTKEEIEELQERFDARYVKRSDCDVRHDSITNQLAFDDKRLAVIEYQQKLNNWLTAAIAGGIIALVIKVFMGG